MIYALFALGSLWFWIVSLVLLVAILVAVETETGFMAGVFLVLGILFFNYCVRLPIIFWALHHPLALLGLFLAYAVVGIGWSVFKWYLFLRKTLVAYKVKGESYGQEYPPQVNRHKSDIIFWLSYWPFSIVGSLLNDFFRNFFNRIYLEISAFLQRMSDKMFADFPTKKDK